MDEYPRAEPPHIGKLHVDLLCWIGMMTDVLKQIAGCIGEPDDAEEYQKAYDDILVNLDGKKLIKANHPPSWAMQNI